MDILLNPIFIAPAFMLGGILSPIVGWARAAKNSEAANFDWLKFLKSFVIALTASLLYFGSLYVNAYAISLSDINIAFVAGFAADKFLKKTLGV